jgi:hypothetical protein
MAPLITALTLILLVFTSSTHASDKDSSKSLPNGCGSGWNRYLVPDSIPVVQCKFKDACNTHDICYSTCEGRLDKECEYRRCRRGGPKCDTDERYLSLAVEAAQRRNKCDNNFYADIVKLNKDRLSCRAFAVIYRDAVKLWGDGNFIGIESVPTLTQSQQDYEKAIRDFFANGTDEQFKKIVDADNAKKKAVDMKRNIRFTQKGGLENVDNSK